MPLLMLAMFNNSVVGGQVAAVKFTLVAVFSSLLILFGFSFLFGLSGALNLIVMKLQIAIIHITNQQIGMTVLLSIVSILVGVILRAGLIPFQGWALAFYKKLPLPLVGFISVGFVAAVIIFFSKVFINGLFAFYGPEMNPNDWGRLVGFTAFVNIVFGTLRLYRQRDFISLIFYSNLIQIGFILTGLVSMRPTGVQAAGFYLCSCLLATFGIYAVFISVKKAFGNTELESLTGLYKSSKTLALTLTTYLMSLAGLPLLSGFVAKYSIIESALERADSSRDYHWLFLLIGAALISTVFVFIRFLKISVSLYRTAETPPVSLKITMATKVLFAITLVATLYFGIIPDWLFTFVSGIPSAFGFIIE
jgi:NADH-quinone oxidoreductase subunit N